MKRLLSLIAALLLLACAACAQGLDTQALHSSPERQGSLYAGQEYLYDTLTLAGSGFDGVQQFTVAALEALAMDEALGLGYENTFSLMTSGGVFSNVKFTGLKMYDFLLYAGLHADLPDNTPVKMISKDGYSLTFALSDIKALYKRYAQKGDKAAEDETLPVLIAFGTAGVPLVGPTGTQPVTMEFTAEHGYDEAVDNIGGPLRSIMSMTDSAVFNAPNCAKWLAAIIVGDPGDYVFSREVDAETESEVPQGGDWTHQGLYPDYTLTVTGSEAKETVFTLAELEELRGGVQRDYFAASGGRHVYEGVTLKYVVEKCLKEGVDAPSKITVVSADGYRKEVNVTDVMNGIDSLYQPSQHRDMLLAYAIDGAPMVRSEQDAGYNGSNAFGPVRLVVENTISAWVKDVVQIIIGEE